MKQMHDNDSLHMNDHTELCLFHDKLCYYAIKTVIITVNWGFLFRTGKVHWVLYIISVWFKFSMELFTHHTHIQFSKDHHHDNV